MPIRDAFHSIRESFRNDPPDGQFLDAISDRPERFQSLYRGVQKKEAIEAIDLLSPILQTSKRGLGEQARNIGALALYITQTKDAAAMQKVSDMLAENPNHIGASTLVRLTRLNAQGHFGEHDKPFIPAKYEKKDETDSIIDKNHALNDQFFSSSYEDTLYENRMVRNPSSGRDNLLFSAASSVALRGNGNLHLYDGIASKVGTKYYYEASRVAAHGKNVRLPTVYGNRLYNDGGLHNEGGIDRFLDENEEKSKIFAQRPEWLNKNSEMKKIIDKIEESGVKIHFNDNACFTSYFSGGEKTIHMAPYDFMNGGKKEYVSVLLHEIGHATNESSIRAASDTYGAMYSRYHEESVAQGISTHLLQKVAKAKEAGDEPLTDQQTIKQHLGVFVRLQKTAKDFSTDNHTNEIHEAINRDIIKGFSSIYPLEQNINPTEIQAINVLDSTRDTLENLKLLEKINTDKIPEKYLNLIHGKQFAKTLNALEKFDNNTRYNTDPILNDYTPKIIEAIQTVKQHVPEGSAYEHTRFCLSQYAEKIKERSNSTQKIIGPEKQNSESTSVKETLLPEIPLIAENSSNAADKLTLKFDNNNNYDPNYIENEYLSMHDMAYKLREASEKSNSKISRFVLRKSAESLEMIADGLLNAQQYTVDNLEKLSKSLSNIEGSLMNVAPQNIQGELKSVLTGIQSKFNPDQSDLKNKDNIQEKTNELKSQPMHFEP